MKDFAYNFFSFSRWRFVFTRSSQFKQVRDAWHWLLLYRTFSMNVFWCLTICYLHFIHKSLVQKRKKTEKSKKNVELRAKKKKRRRKKRNVCSLFFLNGATSPFFYAHWHPTHLVSTYVYIEANSSTRHKQNIFPLVCF